jgi:hypothetical protein
MLARHRRRHKAHRLVTNHPVRAEAVAAKIMQAIMAANVLSVVYMTIPSRRESGDQA